jgi:ectoine hydroxylase-related dioxygenase (phytanoyl-CoA dioxygenase family)
MKEKELKGIYEITDEQQKFYEENGFILLKAVLSQEEVSYYREIIDGTVEELTKHDKRTLAEKTPYEREFLQCGHLWRSFPEIRRFTLSERLGSIAKQLLSAKQVRLWHDQALYKVSGGAATEPHQDIAYWPMVEKDAGTIWLALDNVTVDMGAMRFIPGSHKADLFSYDHNIENAIEGKSDLLEKAKNMLNTEDVSYNLKAGDATFHHALTVHFTGENKTAKTRKGMTVIYYADGVRYDGKSPAAGHHCAAGSIDGDPIATEFNPVII